MKLSHRDFRPQRRSRFVSRPQGRRPTLRILLLCILGLVVYLKFDSVAKAMQGFQPRQWWETFRKTPHPSPEALPLAQSWSSDSQSVSLACPTLPDSCLGPAFPLGSDAAGQARALLAKAAIQLDGDASRGFRADFRKADPASGGRISWELERMDMQGSAGSVQLVRSTGFPGSPFCAGSRCLDEVRPQTPLAAWLQVRVESDTITGAESPQGSGMRARFLPSRPAHVRPVLSGRVVSIPQQGDSSGWLKVHHGRDLYSLYRGFSRLGGSVRAGSMVGTGDTLGWIGPREDSLAGLDVKVEARGATLDAMAFLGLADSLAGVGHDR